MKKKQVLALLLALTMTTSMNPVAVNAEEGTTYKDGTYTKVVKVEPDLDDPEFEAYDLSVDVTIEGGKIVGIKLSEGNQFGTDEDYEDNVERTNRALNGWKTNSGKVHTGVAEQILNINGVEGIDTVSKATCSSNAIISAVKSVLEQDAIKIEEPEQPENPDENPVTGSGYVLMNIPYAQFYAAEGVSSVDTVTTATVKTYNQSKAAGSYHANYIDEEPQSGDEEILGVTYPVYVEDMSVLKDLTKITDETEATITVAKGKSATELKDVVGKDVLFASGDYAYYVMEGEPSNYKTLTVGEDGNFTFGAANGTVVEGTTNVDVKYACHYTDIEFVVDAEEITNAAAMNAIVLTTADGEKYPLRHVENEWNRTDLGWNWEDLDGNGLAGKTITNVKYYLLNAAGEYQVYSYDVNVTMKQNPGTETVAAFADSKTITLTGLPADIKNATATVKTVVGRGETATVIAENVAVENNTIVTTDEAEAREYAITIVSDNYGDISVKATYSEVEGPTDPEEPEQPENPDTPKDDEITKPENPDTPKDDETTKPENPDNSKDDETIKPGTSTDKTPQADTSKTPQTGDESHISLWSGMMFIAAAGAAVVMFLEKLSKKRDDR